MKVGSLESHPEAFPTNLTASAAVEVILAQEMCDYQVRSEAWEEEREYAPHRCYDVD